MHLRPLLVCLAATWLAGCELLPEAPFGQPATSSSTTSAAFMWWVACRSSRPDDS